MAGWLRPLLQELPQPDGPLPAVKALRASIAWFCTPGLPLPLLSSCATKSHTEPSWLATHAGAMPWTHAQAQHCMGRLVPSGARSQVRHSRLNTAPARAEL